MKRAIISTLLVFVAFEFIACGGDNSDDIAAAFEQDECEKNGNYWHNGECVSPCEHRDCGKGTCIATDYDSYKCQCDEGYFNYGDYSNRECVTPCEPTNPCGKGTCIATSYYDYECQCDEGYFHDEQDKDSSTYKKKCVSPCEDGDRICGKGTCIATSYYDYECQCDEGYFHDEDKYSSTYKKCVSPCEEYGGKDCGKGTCIATDYNSPRCQCYEGYFESVVPAYETGFGDYYCVSPCKPTNPCEKGTCIATDRNSYTCCGDSEFFNGSQCTSISEMVECDTKDISPCKDSTTNYIWSARSANAMRGKNAEEYCNESMEAGFSDWKLPSLDVLKTLCMGNQSKIGDTSIFWSSSYESSTSMYNVNFGKECSTESTDYDNSKYHVRCVRW